MLETLFMTRIGEQLNDWGVAFDYDINLHYIATQELLLIGRSHRWLNTIQPPLNTKFMVIWDDVFYRKPEVVFNRIHSLLGRNNRVYARKTVVKIVSKKDCDTFLDKHHLLGTTQGKYRLGLIYNHELVALGLFGNKLRFKTEQEYYSCELVRFACLAQYTVVGGLSKLISHFIKTYTPDDIMTYVDKEWSDGQSFTKIKFKIEEETSPKTFWIDPNTLERYTSLTEHCIPITNQGNYKLRLYAPR